MKRFTLAAFMATLTGCGVSIPTSPAESPMEQHLVSETSRLAGLQRVEVVGVITEKHYSIPYGQQGCTAKVGCEALGWYEAGTAYYNRAMVQQHLGENFPLGTDVAAHEVCHAKNPHHDLAHWECSSKWANPTYPRPGGN